MLWEVEQKFRVFDSHEVETKLAALGAHFQSAIEQIDTYFRHPARDFVQTDEALRLRQIGDDNFITYKGPKVDPHTKTRRELELPLSPGQQTIEQFSELLLALGFTVAGKVVKHRRQASISWHGYHVECALDEVDSLGSFLELEISADDVAVESAKKYLTDLSGNLSLGSSERRSYLDLLLQSRKS